MGAGEVVTGQFGLVFDDGEGYAFSADFIEDFRARSFGVKPDFARTSLFHAPHHIHLPDGAWRGIP